jgi:signal transduction histidine kinase
MLKISHKVWIGMMLVVLMLSGALLAFQHFYLEKYYLDSKVERVKAEILDIVDKQNLDSGSTVFSELDEAAYRMNISIEIVDSDRNSIYVNSQSEPLTESVLQTGGTPNFSILTASLTGYQGSGGSASTGSGNGQYGSQSGSGGSGSDGTMNDSSGSDGTMNSGSGTSGEGSGSGSGHGNQNGKGVMEDGPQRTTMIDDTFDGEDQVETSTHPRYGFEVLVLSILFHSDTGASYVALATIPLAPIDDMIAITSQFLTYASLLLLLIAGVLAYIISRQLTSPIRKLIAAAEKIQKGELDARVSTHSNDEIAGLCQSFNEMADTLEKSGHLRTEIIENVSHEMRTPLSIIKGYADLIGETNANDPETAKSQLAVISKEADRMDFLLGDILDFAQMQAGMLEIKIEPFELVPCVESVIQSYQSKLEDSGLALILQKAADGFVEGDQRRIEQVLHNLIKNAINYAPDDSAIVIQVKDTGDRIKVQISNKGPAIPQEELSLIWDRYYRTKGISKRNVMGSGLGLSIVKSILDAHDAEYGVDSKEPDGTTFWFQLKKSKN